MAWSPLPCEFEGGDGVALPRVVGMTFAAFDDDAAAVVANVVAVAGAVVAKAIAPEHDVRVAVVIRTSESGRSTSSVVPVSQPMIGFSFPSKDFEHP